MFADIRRQQKWLWIVISFFVILSFVWFFSPEARMNRGGYGGGASEAAPIGSINGHPITRKEYVSAYHESELRYLFSYGEWPANDESSRQLQIIERETRNRLLLLEKIKQNKIQATDSAIAQWIIEVFRDREQKIFRKEAYDRFVKERLPAVGLTEEDLKRFVQHEVEIQNLIAVAGTPGKLITPQEAAISYKHENEQVETEGAFFSSSNYIASVTMDPAAIARYYTNQASMYRLPERVQASYVGFYASNHLASADQKIAQETNLTQRLEQIYKQRGANFFTDTNGQVMAAPAAQLKIKEEMRESLALMEARKEAIEFANQLLEMNPKKADNIEKLAAAKGLQARVTPPFSQYEPPPEMKVGEQLGKIAFKLTPEEPFSEQPIVGEDAVFIVGYNKRVPSELPALDTIRFKVVDDYKREQAQTLARQAGITFHTALTNGLAQGKTFQAVCQEAKAPYLKLASFSQTTSTLPEIEDRSEVSMVKNTAFSLTNGQVSPFIPTRDGGFIVHLTAVVPVADAKAQSELPAYLAGLRRSRQTDAFNEWFRKEMELAKISLPNDEKLRR